MTPGDKVAIIGCHPWSGYSAELIAWERYGLGWYGWRVRVDGTCGSEAFCNLKDMVKL